MSEIFFTSPQHKSQFMAAMHRIGKIDHDRADPAFVGKYDPEYAAAVYILTSDQITWEGAERFVTARGIDFEEMLSTLHFSGAYMVLIQLAGNLFNGRVHVDPVELMRLDDTNFKVALTALQVRRERLSFT